MLAISGLVGGLIYVQMAGDSTLCEAVYVKVADKRATESEYLGCVEKARTTWAMKAFALTLLPMLFGLCLARYDRCTKQYRVSSAALHESQLNSAQESRTTRPFNSEEPAPPH